MFNARAETIDQQPGVPLRVRRRRCLVPVDSYYEWKRDGKVRQPYGSSGPTAGRSPWPGSGRAGGTRHTETVRRTFTIVTTTPNDAMSDLHDRMPVVIHEDAWDRWLDPQPADPGELLGLLVPNESVELEVYPVVRLVNDVRRDGRS